MEKFVDIIGFEGYYQISNLLRVKSVSRWYLRVHKLMLSQDRILKPVLSSTGYYIFSFYKNGVKSRQYLHQLVAKHFIPNPENLPQVNHKNGKKGDSRIENLEWCTHQRNMQHACDTGLNKGALGQTGELYSRHRLVLDINTGVYYFGPREASVAKGIKYENLINRLKGQIPNRTGLIYV